MFNVASLTVQLCSIVSFFQEFTSLIRFNAVDAMATLLNRGANPNVPCNSNNCTPLHDASIFGHKTAVECLLQDRRTQVNVGDTQGVTPLYSACCHGYYDICVVLLKHGASAEVRTTTGMTALHFAATNADSKIVTLLLESCKFYIFTSRIILFTLSLLYKVIVYVESI